MREKEELIEEITEKLQPVRLPYSSSFLSQEDAQIPGLGKGGQTRWIFAIGGQEQLSQKKEEVSGFVLKT